MWRTGERAGRSPGVLSSLLRLRRIFIPAFPWAPDGVAAEKAAETCVFSPYLTADVNNGGAGGFCCLERSFSRIFLCNGGKECGAARYFFTAPRIETSASYRAVPVSQGCGAYTGRHGAGGLYVCSGAGKRKNFPSEGWKYGWKKNKGYKLITYNPLKFWSGQRDLNPQPSAWEADTLPLSYARNMKKGLLRGKPFYVRGAGDGI